MVVVLVGAAPITPGGSGTGSDGGSKWPYGPGTEHATAMPGAVAGTGGAVGVFGDGAVVVGTAIAVADGAPGGIIVVATGGHFDVHDGFIAFGSFIMEVASVPVLSTRPAASVAVMVPPGGAPGDGTSVAPAASATQPCTGDIRSLPPPLRVRTTLATAGSAAATTTAVGSPSAWPTTMAAMALIGRDGSGARNPSAPPTIFVVD